MSAMWEREWTNEYDVWLCSGGLENYMLKKIPRHWPSDRLGKAMDVCKWKEDAPYGGWIGSCGVRWECDYETPKENGMNFCPRCGKRLKQKGVADERD